MTTDFTSAPPEDADIFCPLCEYNLRGLAVARCPECGATFEWDELRDPSRQLHPFLFEHHPERNVRSFIRTLVAGLRPGHFWRQLQPSQPSRTRRLVLYWVICILIASISFAIQLVPAARDLNEDNQFQRSILGTASNSSWVQWQVAQGHYSSAQTFLDARYPPVPSVKFLEELLIQDQYHRRAGWWARCYLQCVLAIAWPPVVVAVLISLRATMRRAQVRATHLFRVAIYCDDLIVWFALLAIIPAAIQLFKSNSDLEALSWPLMIALALVLQTYRMIAAIAHYLRFRHAVATAIAVELIFFLAVAKIYLMAIGY